LEGAPRDVEAAAVTIQKNQAYGQRESKITIHKAPRRTHSHRIGNDYREYYAHFARNTLRSTSELSRRALRIAARRSESPCASRVLYGRLAQFATLRDFSLI